VLAVLGHRLDREVRHVGVDGLVVAVHLDRHRLAVERVGIALGEGFEGLGDRGGVPAEFGAEHGHVGVDGCALDRLRLVVALEHGERVVAVLVVFFERS